MVRSTQGHGADRTHTHPCKNLEHSAYNPLPLGCVSCLPLINSSCSQVKVREELSWVLCVVKEAAQGLESQAPGPRAFPQRLDVAPGARCDPDRDTQPPAFTSSPRGAAAAAHHGVAGRGECCTGPRSQPPRADPGTEGGHRLSASFAAKASPCCLADLKPRLNVPRHQRLLRRRRCCLEEPCLFPRSPWKQRTPQFWLRRGCREQRSPGEGGGWTSPHGSVPGTSLLTSALPGCPFF